MEDSIYCKLQEQLDQYSFGFPKTESGVEIALLKKLFTEKEVYTYLNLSLEPEPVEAVAHHLTKDLSAVSALLETMFEKGLVFRIPMDGVLLYSAAPFMIGIYENQVPGMDRYLRESFLDRFVELPNRPTRILPVNQAVTEKGKNVTTSLEAGAYIEKQDRVAIGDCLCKTQQGVLDQACKKPREVCMTFGWYADYMVELHAARRVTIEEALEIQRQCDESGLVTFSGNVNDPIVLCHCCSCCCIGLRAFSAHPRPADLTNSNYYAFVDESACVVCGTCVDRCPMDAIGMDSDEIAMVKRERCIGCGVCVTGCETEAIRLHPKPNKEQPGEPGSSMELAVGLAQARGKQLAPLYRKP